MDLFRKSFRAEVKQAPLDSPDGSIQAIVSVFSNRDDGGEVVMPGAFANSLQNQLPYFCNGHDWSAELGVTLEAKELFPGDALLPDEIKQNGGLFVRGKFFTNDPEAQRIRSNIAEKLANGARQEFSIGYAVKRAHRVTEEGDTAPVDPFMYLFGGGKNSTLYLDELELFEWSPVLVGMNRETALLEIKSGRQREVKAQWSTQYINDLEDNCFAGIEPGGEKDDEGKTTPRDLRHLPHHAKGNGGSGTVDVVHLRNALSRVEQMQNVSTSFQDKCRAHLEKHAADLGIGDRGTNSLLSSAVQLPSLVESTIYLADILGQEVQTLALRRAKEGRVLSSANVSRLEGYATSLEEAAAGIRDLLSNATQPKGRLLAEALLSEYEFLQLAGR